MYVQTVLRTEYMLIENVYYSALHVIESSLFCRPFGLIHLADMLRHCTSSDSDGVSFQSIRSTLLRRDSDPSQLVLLKVPSYLLRLILKI